VLWDGDEIPQQRVGTSNFTLRGARFTVGLQVQEAVLRDYVKRSKGLPKQIGFFGRCLIAWPESTQGDRLYRSAPSSWPKLSTYNKRIRELLAKPLQRNEQNQLTPVVLEMTPEAHHSWIDFYNKTEKEQAVGGKYEEITDIASKAADNVSRLACLFHVVSGGTGGIGADSINRAGRIIEWYLNESIRFYKAIGASDQHADAACLEKWLIDYSRKHNLETVSKSDVLKLGPNRFRKKDKLEMPLQELSEHNRVFERPEGNKSVLVIHPKLLK
jgi:putative DNA primase/helicase